MKKYVDVLARVTVYLILTFCFLPAAATEFKLEKKSDFGGSAVFSSSLGVGTFISGYGKIPSLTSSLTLMPEYKLSAFVGLPPMKLVLMTSLSAWLLNSFYTTQFQTKNRVTYSDISLALTATKIVDVAGFSLSPSLAVIAPISQLSRNFNRLVGLQIITDVTYKKSDFLVGWNPSFTSWIYKGTSMTSSCDDGSGLAALPRVVNPQTINFDLGQYLQELAISHQEGRNADGTCRIAGRQTVGMLANTVRVAWAPGRHNLSAIFGWYLNFLRPLENKPELRGRYASPLNLTEATMGELVYAYQIPVNFNLVFSAGVVSYQTAFSGMGKLNFPFFDFITPGKNQTQFFLQLTVGI